MASCLSAQQMQRVVLGIHYHPQMERWATLGSSPLANKEILSSQLGSPKQIFLAGGKDV